MSVPECLGGTGGHRLSDASYTADRLGPAGRRETVIPGGGRKLARCVARMKTFASPIRIARAVRLVALPHMERQRSRLKSNGRLLTRMSDAGFTACTPSSGQGSVRCIGVRSRGARGYVGVLANLSVLRAHEQAVTASSASGVPVDTGNSSFHSRFEGNG